MWPQRVRDVQWLGQRVGGKSCAVGGRSQWICGGLRRCVRSRGDYQPRAVVVDMVADGRNLAGEGFAREEIIIKVSHTQPRARGLPGTGSQPAAASEGERTFMDLDDEEADLQRALALSRDDAPPTAPTPPPEPVAADVTVLGQIPTKFRIIPAAAVGNLSLEATARVLLPAACLNVISAFFGDAMPGTLLLRLVGGDGSCAYVGVADFVDDGQCAAWLASAAGPQARGQELPRLFARGPLAACFVPRWVRGALVIDPMLPEASLQIVSLPLATHMLLRPRTNDFATALAAHGDGDVAATLTDLMNRFPAASKGASFTLHIGGAKFLVDVLALRGLRRVRCGTAAVVGPQPAAASDLEDDGSELVPAACLVDANVKCDFAPSLQTEAEESARAAQARAALARRLADQEAAAAAEAADAARRESEMALATEQHSEAAAALAALEADAAIAADPVRVACAVKLPDGTRCTFNVASCAPLMALWWSVDVQVGGGMRDYALVTSYPRRKLLRPSCYPRLGSTEDTPTLRSEGLAEPPQQAFFVEAL